MRGKTIQVFLTDGTPRGIKFAEITSNIEQAIFIPRNKINEASSRKEVSRPGLYFLFGESDDSSKPIAYIGQSRNSLNRIRTHDQKKKIFGIMRFLLFLKQIVSRKLILSIWNNWLFQKQ